MLLKISQNSQDGTDVSCEFCEIFENSYFYKTSPVAASNDLWITIDVENSDSEDDDAISNSSEDKI